MFKFIKFVLQQAKNMKKAALLLLVVSTLFSCAKQAENKLNGKWIMIPTSDFVGDSSYWNFGTNGDLTITYPNDSAVHTAAYKVVVKNAKNHIRITGLDTILGSYEPMNADWQILKLNKEFLKMAHNTPAPGANGKGLVYREFVKY